MKAHTIPENGGQSVPIPKTDMHSTVEKNKPAPGVGWSGYGNEDKTSGKGNIWTNVKKK